MHVVPLHAGGDFQLQDLQLHALKHGADFDHLTVHGMGNSLAQWLKQMAMVLDLLVHLVPKAM